MIYLYFGGLADGRRDPYSNLIPALDFDGDPTTFSESELEFINEVYLGVAEDYAPFNVTVTTDQSVFDAATNWIRVVFTGISDVGDDGVGGYAFLNTFGRWRDMDSCYIFRNSKYSLSAGAVAANVSHEVGHTVGLEHDGFYNLEYYRGSSLWGPIMGNPAYNPDHTHSTLIQWSKGEYEGATNTEDDIAILAGLLGFKEDDYGNSLSEASELSESYLNAGNLIADGIITNEDDVDFFRFVATDSTYVIDVVGTGADFSNADENGCAASLGYTNLDLLVKVYDAAGSLLYTCDPTDSLFAHFQLDGLNAGETYYLSVEGTGCGDTTVPGEGYTAYGSVGQYFVTISATTLANFVGEERYESLETKTAIQTGAATASYGEAYDKVYQSRGGGVFNHNGRLTVVDSSLLGNRADGLGGGVYAQGGETKLINCAVESNNALCAVYSEDATLSLESCALRSNSLDGLMIKSGDVSLTSCDVGGNGARGICVYDGEISLTDCAITGNSGGGIDASRGVVSLKNCEVVGNSNNSVFIGSDAVLTATNTLIAGNIGKYRGYRVVYVGGLELHGTATFYNCTVAGNDAGDVNLGKNAVLNAYNTIILNVCSFANEPYGSFDPGAYNTISGETVANAYNTLSNFTDWTNGENHFVYDASQPLFTNAASGDYTLAENSQAINRGNNQYATTSVDFAGNARIVGGTIDLGAYESVVVVDTPSTVVTTADDVFDFSDGKISLREAIFYAFSGDAITFDSSLRDATIALNREVWLNWSATIDASNLWDEENQKPGLTISGNGATRLFEVAAGTEANPVTFKGLTFADGYHSDVGGAIWASSGYVTVKNSVFTGNSADNGGAVFVGSDASLTLTNSDFTQNVAAYGGGGVYADGSLTITGGTFQENSAATGGALFNRGTLALENCVVNDNDATGWGGGVYSENGEITAVDSALTNNTASGRGGAIAASFSSISLDNCDVNYNEATGGGGIFCADEWGNVDGGEITAVDSSFMNNIATDGDGGAIYGFVSSLVNCEVGDNQATGSGGGVFSAGGGNTTLTNCAVTNNTTSSGSGGGVYIDCGEGGTTTVSGGAFTNNSSGGITGRCRSTVAKSAAIPRRIGAAASTLRTAT